ncbi:hypothetical protein COV19_04470 [Candidatus Woesearchaeota archaeon CG10_big_fil_rev_8_21_14_0_10_44_13]|nr:MAG: hypothetical protein COV19_04470 [Candidatus Woesearchaeota archaeon CG10_big_fil_rev_8_21_14_0_10_44_13]
MAIKYNNLTLMGTSHIARQSINEVKAAIAKKPHIVAVELDKPRLQGLKSRKTTKIRVMDIFRIGVTGFVFAVIGAWAQKKLGSIVGVDPGAEMLAAVKLANRSKIRLELIDQDIRITLNRLSRFITLKEKLRFFYDVLKAIFFRKREMKRLGINDFDLSKVPQEELIQKLMSEMKKSYPNAYKVLVEERNMFMARRIFAIMQQNPGKEILAVVGAGHEKELIAMIAEKEDMEKVTYEFTVGG